MKSIKFEQKIHEDLNKLAIKLKDVPEFKYLRGISSAYDEGIQKYQNLGLLDNKETVDHQMVALVMLKEMVRRCMTGDSLGVYDNEMLHSYFVSDDEVGHAITFEDGRY